MNEADRQLRLEMNEKRSEDRFEKKKGKVEGKEVGLRWMGLEKLGWV